MSGYFASEFFCALTVIYLHMNRKVPVACNFNCLIKTERLLKVAGSHIRCRCDNISDTMQDTGRHVVTNL